MKFFAFLFVGVLVSSEVRAQEEPVVVTTPAPSIAPAEAPAATPAETDTGDYEIDYEEEPEENVDAVEESGDEEAPVDKKSKAKSKKTKQAVSGGAAGDKTTSVTGTRSKNKFAPMMKSDAKSVYKKNGKPLDVDTD